MLSSTSSSYPSTDLGGKFQQRRDILESGDSNPYALPSKTNRRRYLRSASLNHVRVPPRKPAITSMAGRHGTSGWRDKHWQSLTRASVSCQSTSHCPHQCPTSTSSKPSGSMRRVWQIVHTLRHGKPWLPIFLLKGRASETGKPLLVLAPEKMHTLLRELAEIERDLKSTQ